MSGKICTCGCGKQATYLVKSVGMDDQPFTAAYCRSAYQYLAECAHTFEKPFTHDFIFDEDDDVTVRIQRPEVFSTTYQG